MTLPIPPSNSNGSSWASLIRDIGFPILVALFLLYQIPPLARAIDNLSTTLSRTNELQTQQLNELRAHRERTERRHPEVEE